MSRSLAARAAGAWADPGASWAEERARGGGEARLAAFAFGAALFLTLGRVAAETLAPTVAAPDRTAWFAATVFIGFSFGVLALYLAAALIRLACALFRGGGDWAGARLALFWSGAAAGPAMAAAHALGAAAGAPAAGAAAGGLAWLWPLSGMLARAEGFAPHRLRLALGTVACAVILLRLW